MDWVWDNSAKLAEIATLVAAVFVVVALVAGWRQFMAQAVLRREAAAKDSFRGYLMLAIEYPRFASPHLSDVDYKQETFDGSKAIYRSYGLFVSTLLLACDQVLQNNASDVWKRSLKAQLEHHWRYLLKGFDAVRPEYSAELGALVDEVVRERRFTPGRNPLSNMALTMAQRVFGPR